MTAKGNAEKAILDSAHGSAVWPAMDRPVLGKDLDDFRKRFRLDLNKMETSFGIPSRRAWYQLTSSEPDENGDIPENQPVTISVAIFLRFLARNPHYIPLLMKSTAEELRDRMGLSPAAFGLLTGRQEISVRQWTDKREPHKVVCNILCIVEDLLDQMEGKVPPEDAESTLADLINCALVEWMIRGETPESRRKTGKITPAHPQAVELLMLLTPRTQPISLGTKVTRNLQKVLADARAAKDAKSADGGVTPQERRKATKGVRQRRLANKMITSMADSFSLDDSFSVDS